MIHLDYVSFQFYREDPKIEGPRNRVPYTVHFMPLGGIEYSIRVYGQNKLISLGTLTGSPDRWIAEVFVMRGILDPMIFSEDLTG